MWAQLIEMRLKPGREGDLPAIVDAIAAAEMPDSGLLRTSTMVDQKDPARVFTMVVFESEEKARAREQDPRREEPLAKARALMADAFDGPPTFVDLTVTNDRVL